MSGPSPDYDVYAHYGRYLLERIDQKMQTVLGSTPTVPELPDGVPVLQTPAGQPAAKRKDPTPTKEKPVGILGAGNLVFELILFHSC